MVQVVTLDLSSLDSLEGKAEEVIQVLKIHLPPTFFSLQMFGQLDVLINCGGVSVRGGAVETMLEVHKRVMDTNYFGIFRPVWEILLSVQGRWNLQGTWCLILRLRVV